MIYKSIVLFSCFLSICATCTENQSTQTKSTTNEKTPKQPVQAIQQTPKNWFYICGSLLYGKINAQPTNYFSVFFPTERKFPAIKTKAQLGYKIAIKNKLNNSFSLQLNYTYLKNTNSTTRSFNDFDFAFFDTIDLPVGTNSAVLKTNQSLKWQKVELMAKQNFCDEKSFLNVAFLGSIFYANYKRNYTEKNSFVQVVNPAPLEFLMENPTKQRTQGFGAAVGLNFKYNITRCFYAFSKANVGLLVGQYDNTQRFLLIGITQDMTFINFIQKNKFNMGLLPNFDLKFGFGTKTVLADRYSLALKVAYEMNLITEQSIPVYSTNPGVSPPRTSVYNAIYYLVQAGVLTLCFGF